MVENSKSTITYCCRWASSYCALSAAGEVKAKGVLTPTTKEIYGPILKALKEEGIEARINSTFAQI